MIVLKVLGCLVLVLLLALLIPVTVRLSCDREAGEAQAVLQVLFFRRRLLPAPPAKEGKPKPAGQGEKAGRQPAASGLSFREIWPLVRDALAAAPGPVRFLLHSVLIRNVTVQSLSAKGDAFETAVAYGRMNQRVYTAMAFLKVFFRFRNTHIDLRVDFLGEEERFAAQGEIRVVPLPVLAAGLWFAGRFLRRAWKSGSLFGKKKQTGDDGPKRQRRDHKTMEVIRS